MQIFDTTRIALPKLHRPSVGDRRRLLVTSCVSRCKTISLESPVICRPLLILCLATSCSHDERTEATTEQQFIASELAQLQAAIAARDEVKITTECVVVGASVDHVSRDLVKKIEQDCYVEAPRIHLAIAVDAVKKWNAEHPDPALADMSCMQLFVSDALETLERHPTTDAGVSKLAEEYAHLCPKQVAGFHLHGRAKP